MPNDPSRFRLNRADVALVLIDVQERLSAVMEPGALAAVQQNLLRWLRAAQVLGFSVYWTEQYVKGLGPTVAAVRAAVPAGVTAHEKLAFSALAVPEVRKGLQAKRQVIAIGMETHVCVWQTVRDLEALGVRTFVPADAVISRTEANRQLALDAMRQLGTTVISTEQGLFDLTGSSGTDEFRAISKLVK